MLPKLYGSQGCYNMSSPNPQDHPFSPCPRAPSVKGGSRRMLMVFHSEPCTLTHPHNSAVLYDDMAATLDGPFAPLMAPAIIDCGTGGGLLGVQWNSRDARYNDIGRKDTSLGESCTGWPIEWLETGVGSRLSGERGSHLASGAWRKHNLNHVITWDGFFQ
jgi:hypothetical protein